MNITTKIKMGIAVVGLTALLAGCDKRISADGYIIDSTIPLKDEGVYLEVDSSFKYGTAIASADWDKDGYLDILSSDGEGLVFLHRNTGDGTYIKSEKSIFQLPASFNFGCSLDVVDIDKDGDLDVLSSDGKGEIHLYRNMEK